MADVSIYLLPGMRVKIKVPKFYVGYGARRISDSNGEPVEKELQNGFMVEFDDVGEIDPVPNEPAIIYTHKKFSKNSIIFFGRNPGERCTISVIAVPIHDHSSIVSGGPAYATYFSDDETISGE